MRKKQPPSEVKGTPGFQNFFSTLNKEEYLRKIVNKGLNLLEQDMLAGTKIEKRLFPKYYTKKFGITNLFLLDLDPNFRLTYTIVAEKENKIVAVLEVMDHKAYNQRFRYKSR